MRHLDLFAGIGGFSLAARWMWWETVAQVEWDEWCQKVLAKNFPDALRFGDIVEFNKMLGNGEIIQDARNHRCLQREIKEEGASVRKQWKFSAGNSDGIYREPIKLGHIDIITGGFPCQPFSHAGKRKGTDDSRYLWPAMLETIRRVKPAYVVGENVAGLVSMENGKTLDRILSDLEDEGYTTEQVIIPACAVGAWHRRDRIWIIAHSVNRANRTNRGQSGETEGLPCECGETGHSGLSCGTDSEVYVSHSFSGGQQEQGQYEQPVNTETIRNRETVEFGTGGTSDQRGVESRLGGMAYGLPCWVDGYWDREPEGVPRVATGVKDRVNRLKGLGNAIVPQVALQIFKAIQQFNELNHEKR